MVHEYHDYQLLGYDHKNNAQKVGERGEKF